MVRDTARGYRAGQAAAARDRGLPRGDSSTATIMPEMGELGLLGPTIPEEYGGAGLGYVAYGLIAREIERVDSGYRSAMSVQSSLVMYPIYAYGTEAQRRKYLPKLATGEIDRLLRPDRAGPRLRSGLDGDARREGRRRLQAQRRQDVDHQLADRRRRSWSGRSSTASSAASSSSAARRASRRRRSKASSRCAPRSPARSCWTTAFVPEENLLPNVKGLAGPFGCLNKARYGIAWGAMGAAEFCWHARAPIRARPQAVRPAARRQPAGPEEARRHADRDRARACRARCGSAA